LVATRHDHHDELEIWIEISSKLFFDKMREQRSLVDAIRHKVANFIGITPTIKLVEGGSLEREGDVVKLFVDRDGGTG
jgi:phenylacetate-CoA ligase